MDGASFACDHPVYLAQYPAEPSTGGSLGLRLSGSGVSLLSCGFFPLIWGLIAKSGNFCLGLSGGFFFFFSKKMCVCVMYVCRDAEDQG